MKSVGENTQLFLYISYESEHGVCRKGKNEKLICFATLKSWNIYSTVYTVPKVIDFPRYNMK